MLSLSNSGTTSSSGIRRPNPLASLAIHPAQPVSEGQMQASLDSLLRMMRIPEVLASDIEVVARMDTEDVRTDEDIIVEMGRIQEEHDYRVERAQMAVRMLREKYDWKKRVIDEPPEEDSSSSEGEDDGDEEMDAAVPSPAAVPLPSNAPPPPPPPTRLEMSPGNTDADGDDDDDDMEMVTAEVNPSPMPSSGGGWADDGDDDDDMEMVAAQ